MKSNSTSRVSQSTLDPTCADYYPQSQQFRLSNGAVGVVMGGASGGFSILPTGSNIRGSTVSGSVSYGYNALQARGGVGLVSGHFQNGTVSCSPFFAGTPVVAVGGYPVSSSLPRGSHSNRGGGATTHGVVFSNKAVNHNASINVQTQAVNGNVCANRSSGKGNARSSQSQERSSRNNNNKNNNSGSSSSVGKHLPATDLFFDQLSAPVPTALRDEWVGETPKFSPAVPDVPADQLQSIFAQLLSPEGLSDPSSLPKISSAAPSPTLAPRLPEKSPKHIFTKSITKHYPTNSFKNTPSLGALSRGEAANGVSTFSEVDVDLSSLIAQLPPPEIAYSGVPFGTPVHSRVKNQEDQRPSSPRNDSKLRTSFTQNVDTLHAQDKSPEISRARIGRYTSHIEVPEASGPIHISANAFVPTPQVSPSMVPQSVTVDVKSSNVSYGGAIALPSQHDHDLPAEILVSRMGPTAVCLSPSLSDREGDDGSLLPVKPNLASLFTTNEPKPQGPPPGSMAEKLISGGKGPGAGLQQQNSRHNAHSSSILGSKLTEGLPTTKAGIEKFLKEGNAPETLRHIKILAFSHEYPSEVKALFDLWAGNGIPPPDDAFGAYYWYVRKKIGRDLCMKHNGPGKAPGVGYGGCDYAARGQGQCRYHHQCLFCTKEDHGWFDEQKCGRYKTYQKELSRLGLNEDQIYELVNYYCKSV